MKTQDEKVVLEWREREKDHKITRSKPFNINGYQKEKKDKTKAWSEEAEDHREGGGRPAFIINGTNVWLTDSIWGLAVSTPARCHIDLQWWWERREPYLSLTHALQSDY